jgi:hypothetical protein
MWGMSSLTTEATGSFPRVRIGHRRIPVVLPSLRDPRMHVAATLLTVQVLGQTVIDWDLSIAQLLLALGTCFVLEVALVLWRQGVLAWPASALLTGNGIALLLRIPGTEHGDWWSTKGAGIIVATSAFAVLSKYLVRVDDRPLFNPSNVGLVACFLVVGALRADPQDFWWGPWGLGLAATYAVIVVGGVAVTRRLGLLGIAVAFWGTFALALGVVAASGHAITARWHVGLLTGAEFWWVVVSSPETLIFLFFMITDPRTVPRGRTARLVFGAGVGVLAALLAAPQRTEYATKVAILAALTVVCALRPVLERVRLRRRSLAVLGAAALVPVLVLSGSHSRDLLPDFEVVGDRPAVDPGPVPEVVIDDSVEGVTLPFDRDDVDDLGRDLAEDLAIEAEALRTEDPDVATHAAIGVRLADLEARVGHDQAVPRYRFDTLTLILHRELAEGQAAPRLGLEAHGSVRLDRAVDGRLEPGETQAFEAVYLLTEVDGRWLIDDQRPVPEP